MKETEDASLAKTGIPKVSGCLTLFLLFDWLFMVVLGLMCWMLANRWLDILAMVASVLLCLSSVRQFVMVGFAAAQVKALAPE